MDIRLEKQVEDIRGKIFFFSQGNKNFNLLEIKKGFARGGHYHYFAQLHIILTGKLEYYKKDLTNNKEEVIIINSPDSIMIPANTPHLFIALEDSALVEVYEDSYKAIDYKEFRNIVDDRMKQI